MYISNKSELITVILPVQKTKLLNSQTQDSKSHQPKHETENNSSFKELFESKIRI